MGKVMHNSELESRMGEVMQTDVMECEKTMQVRDLVGMRSLQCEKMI
jgi:hypothetical protein